MDDDNNVSQYGGTHSDNLERWERETVERSAEDLPNLERFERDCPYTGEMIARIEQYDEDRSLFDGQNATLYTLPHAEPLKSTATDWTVHDPMTFAEAVTAGNEHAHQHYHERMQVAEKDDRLQQAKNFLDQHRQSSQNQDHSQAEPDIANDNDMGF